MAERSTATLDTSAQSLWIDDVNVTRNWRQPRRLSVSEWADEHRVLDPLFAAEPGPWQTNRAPYTREVMDSAGLAWVRRIAWMASTQVGKSESENNILGFFIHQKPSPAMVALPNRDAARLASERRVLPMVRASDALTDELTERAHDVKNRELVFKRSVLYMRSAQSPTDLASVPVRLVLCDEVDKWPKWSGKEADPISLIDQRTQTYHDHVVMLASTPTTRDGNIHREYELGDRRKFHVPCPHCKLLQVFEWNRVEWDRDSIRSGNQMRDERSAWYRCRSKECGGVIEDQHKRDMLRAGVWVPERASEELTDDEWVQWWINEGQASDRADRRSYHIWAAYSPWVTFWKIVAAFLDSKDDPAKLMNFTNSWLAEIWEERVSSTSDEAIAACVDVDRPSYEVPEDVMVITASVDVQLDYVVWQVCGWGYDEQCYVIAMGQCETFEQLDTELVRPWGDKKLMPRCIVLDSRYRRDEVMEFCRSNKDIARMIAGVERTNPIPFSTTRIDKHPKTGQVLKNSMTVWTINVGMFKDLVAHRFRIALDPEKRDTAVGKLRLPSDLEPHWIEQMHSEHKVVERSGNKQVRRWVLKPGRKRNEGFDVTVYNAAAARLIRVDTLRSADRSGDPRGSSRNPRPNRRVMGQGRRGVNLPRGQW